MPCSRLGSKALRRYLYGRKFRLVTDCHSVMSVRDPSSRLARWNLQLQEYCSEVEHKADRAHLNADALSRTAAVSAVGEFVPVNDLAELHMELRKDPDLTEANYRELKGHVTRHRTARLFH